MSARIRITIFVAVALIFGPQAVQAQLPQDVRDVFAGLIDDLEPDLARKFEIAIQNDTATVEFTPEQFRRFRDDPVNPFDGLDEINAVDGGGNIALKFELPSLRERPVDRFETTKQKPARESARGSWFGGPKYSSHFQRCQASCFGYRC